MSTSDNSTVGFFGENSKNPSTCALIKLNRKCEETVVAEVDYRMDCTFGCVNGEYFFLNGPDCSINVKPTRLAMIESLLLIFLIFQDIVHIIGGNNRFSADFNITYEVITFNLNTRVIPEA